MLGRLARRRGAAASRSASRAVASGALLTLAERAGRAPRLVGRAVIVNDRADVARMAGAAGVHVGQDDLPADVVRRGRRREGDRRVVDAHERAGDAALAEPVGYLAVGPVFGTRPRTPGIRVVGLEVCGGATARAAAAMPVVAIGGITLERAPAVLEAGASAVAVIADLLSAAIPPGARATFLTGFARSR